MDAQNDIRDVTLSVALTNILEYNLITMSPNLYPRYIACAIWFGGRETDRSDGGPGGRPSGSEQPAGRWSGGVRSPPAPGPGRTTWAGFFLIPQGGHRPQK